MCKKNYVLLSSVPWHRSLFENLKQTIAGHWVFIDNKADFTKVYLENIKPDKIFIPHWSFIIPASIYENHECIVFHMTDLPYGRGGTPLQNLIVRGHTSTKISALRIVQALDAGDIYLKNTLSLTGSAQEIYDRAAIIIEAMIKDIVQNQLTPNPQSGNVVAFQRRTPAMSELTDDLSLAQIYDYIRMLDAPGYPHAFIETNEVRIAFTQAEQHDNQVSAHVTISKK